ncbi:MAG: flagellar basal body P-ring formation protein FlgA [Oleiphilaceae bacterium]|nr:flagellar basal body P-ring formation protein FlgA [Oleiphilaceae bacterium]
MRILVFISILLVPGVALANTGTGSTKAQIMLAAEGFLNNFAATQKSEGFTVSFEVGNLDSRLQLAACDNGPSVTFSGDPWRSTHPRLLISCDGDRPWKLFLGTDLTIEGKALTAAQPLNRGTRLSETMITTSDVVVNSLRRGAVTKRQHLVGMEMRRTINAGTVFTPDLVTRPDAVARGDHVTISARSGNFSVRSRGKALANGRVGEQVLVENLGSSRRVRGLITGPGQVEIPM